MSSAVVCTSSAFWSAKIEKKGFMQVEWKTKETSKCCWETKKEASELVQKQVRESLSALYL